jgi:nitroreductase
VRDVIELMQRRHLARGPYDPACRIADRDLRRILEAARWAPTAYNMQAFEIVVVDDPASLAQVGAIRRVDSTAFLREKYR